MSNYKHLSAEERNRIAELKANGLGVTAIARDLGRDKSTISRELRRNGQDGGVYRPIYAEGSYLYRRQRPARLETDAALRTYVVDRLMEGWTPEQIAGRLRKGIDRLGPVSLETIYAWIYSKARKAEKLWRYLPMRRATRRPMKARRSKDRISGKTHISERSEAANARAEAGHWEGDLISGSGNSHIAALVERASRFTILVRVNGKDTTSVTQALIRKVRNLPADLRRTLTWDRGMELAKHKEFTIATNVAVYFWYVFRGVTSFFMCDL